jgi:hypothetical protein
MTRKLVVSAASMVTIVMGATLLATPARAAGADGECPLTVAQRLTAVAEKACKVQGKEAVITYMNCENGVADLAYACV